MCSPHLSFLINKLGHIFYKDGLQAHSELAKYYNIDEDKMIKVDYDWVNKVIDIIGDNEKQNMAADFQLKDSHYRAIDSFIKKQVGTKEKLINWLKQNCNDVKICDEAYKILSEAGEQEFLKLAKPKSKILLMARIGQLFEKFPNQNWGDKIPA